MDTVSIFSEISNSIWQTGNFKLHKGRVSSDALAAHHVGEYLVFLGFPFHLVVPLVMAVPLFYLWNKIQIFLEDTPIHFVTAGNLV